MNQYAEKAVMPKVSVIIPVYNAAPYLRRCLNSVCGQTLRDIEIICVNDASTDGSLDILNEYAAKDGRMRVVSLEKNSGESATRNTALALVQGEYTGSVDNDDMVDLDFYEKLYAKAKETGADIVKGNCRVVGYDGKSNIVNINYRVDENKFYFSSQWWCAIYRTKLIIDNNIRFPNNLILGGDAIFLCLAVIFCMSIQTCDSVFYHYYRLVDSWYSLKFNREKLLSVLNTLNTIIDYYNKYRETYISDAVYTDLIFNIFRQVTEDLPFHGTEYEYKKICADEAIRMYAKCACKETLKNRNKFSSYIYNFLELADRDGLLRYMIKNNTRAKMMASNLRAGLRDCPNDV